jgi:N-acetylglucosaminyldiphosphoundecaprenol N-acetyl-beta-D-mannosaminyltransferase
MNVSPNCYVVPARGSKPELDLGRDVHAHLGLIFDCVTLDTATAQLRACAASGKRCFFSTPNTNFAMTAMHDAAFRDSVLQSDLSVADGMPVVALARWLRIPLPERVAGADLFERLRAPTTDPCLTFFFFGGDAGIAERAARAINAIEGSARSVGYFDPGFVDVESMSGDEVIDRVNSAGPSFVVVSLGAVKGQAWIQRNRGRLKAPLVSHLGAVVNFAAGRVLRSPRWMQLAGLEWLWRVACEPSLWRRYAKDGLAVLRWLLVVWPARRRLHARSVTVLPSIEATPATHPGAPVRLVLHGTWDRPHIAALRQALSGLLTSGHEVHVDMANVADIDSAVFGLLALVHGWQRPRRTVVTRFSELCPRVADRVRVYGMQFLFEDLP